MQGGVLPVQITSHTLKYSSKCKSLTSAKANHTLGYMTACENLTSAKKLVILVYTFFLSCKEVLPVQITSQNILPSAKVLPVQKKAAGTYGARNLTSAKKASYTLIHIFSCRAIGSYQCKKLARNILPSAKVLPVQKKN